MKKIISIILVSIIGISIIPKTLVNEKHIVLESTTSVYTKEEVDSLLSTIRTNITNNTNEITNIKNELTTLKNSLNNYALKTSLNTTNSNIDNLNSIVTDNTSRIEALEALSGSGDNDLYSIWQPYGNSEWVAPRNGKIKVTIFVFGYYTSTNMRIFSASGFGITASSSSYSGDSTLTGNSISSAFQTTELDVTEGQTFTMTKSTTGAAISRYGAFITYID